MKCYLCLTLSRFLFRKNGYDLFVCPSCGLIQTRLGMPYEKFLKEFYVDGYFTGDDGAGAYKDYAADKPNIVRNMQTLLQHILKYKNKGTLLDVGCAYGYMLELVQKNGFTPYGFDTSSYALSHIKKGLKKNTRSATVETISYKKKFFDVITMLDVVEHLDDPVNNLKKLRNYLKDDGIVLIATGDTNSFLARLLKKRWTFFIPPQHLFFFNKKTMTAMLQKAGFTPIQFSGIGKWVSLSYVLHLGKTSSESTLASALIPIVEKLHLGSLPLCLPLGDNMVVVAKKLRSLDAKQDEL